MGSGVPSKLFSKWYRDIIHLSFLCCNILCTLHDANVAVIKTTIPVAQIKTLTRHRHCLLCYHTLVRKSKFLKSQFRLSSSLMKQ
jgi:hypothetical protein